MECAWDHPTGRTDLRSNQKLPNAGLLPFGLGITMLVFGPLVVTGVLAFTDYDAIRPAGFVGLANFTELWNDPIFRIALRNSGAHVAVSVPLRMAGALGLALLLSSSSRTSRWGRTAVMLPTILPDAAYALVWLWLLNPVYGPVNAVAARVGAQPGWFSDPSMALPSMVLLGLFQIGEGFVICLAARQLIPPTVYDVAAVEGLHAVQVLRRITLPIMAPTLLLLALRDLGMAAHNSFSAALLITDGGPAPYATTVVPLFVYRTSFEYLRFGYGAAATAVMLVATAAVVVAQVIIVRRWTWRPSEDERRP